jgi:hypothetical protein
VRPHDGGFHAFDLEWLAPCHVRIRRSASDPLRDGYIDMPPTRLRDEDGRTLDELPAAVPLAGDNLRMSVNAFFVTDGTRSVLIDTGASNAWHDPPWD